ncbi:MAG: hypothetical protein U0836_20610 [Pirellulales bacterium]
MTATCIDLKSAYGRRYRIGTDPAAGSRNTDPWLWVIPCRYGEIHPQGGNRLAAWTDRAGRIAAELKRLPCVEVLQDGDDGATVAFDVVDFKQVAAIIRPKRRRKPLTQEQRDRLVAIGEPHRLKKSFAGVKHVEGGEGTQPTAGVVSLTSRLPEAFLARCRSADAE